MSGPRLPEAQTGSAPRYRRTQPDDDDADYEAVHTYQAESLSPQVSTPSNPENAVPVDEVVGTRSTSCSSGRVRTDGTRHPDRRDIIEGEQLAPDTDGRRPGPRGRCTNR